MVSRPKLRLFRYLVPVIIVLAFIFSFRQCGKQEKPAGHPCVYAAIAKEGIIRVATEYNSISFYVDSDTVSVFITTDTGIRPGQRTQSRNNTYYEFRRAVGRIKRGTL